MEREFSLPSQLCLHHWQLDRDYQPSLIQQIWWKEISEKVLLGTSQHLPLYPNKPEIYKNVDFSTSIMHSLILFSFSFSLLSKESQVEVLNPLEFKTWVGCLIPSCPCNLSKLFNLPKFHATSVVKCLCTIKNWWIWKNEQKY